jgi:hypothetical protein
LTEVKEHHTFGCRLLFGHHVPFLWLAYVELLQDVSNSNTLPLSHGARRSHMFDLALVLGGLLVCGFIVYERLCNKW